MELPKLVTYRSSARLQWVRDMNCLCCGLQPPSEPHHVTTGGVGKKCSDRLTIPLCHRCHRLVQTRMWDELAVRWGFAEIDVWRGAALLMDRWDDEHEGV